MKKENYEEAVIDVIEFETIDIVTASESYSTGGDSPVTTPPITLKNN